MAGETTVPSSSASPNRRRLKALDFALRRLTRRAHSEGELSEKMLRAGYPPDEIEQTTEFLRRRRYLDDRVFARDFARARAERRQWGPARIELQLRQRHVSDDDIGAALSEVFPDGEDEAAERALSRFLRSRRPSTSSAKQQARAYRHLLGRGYSADIVHRLVSGADFEDTDTLEK